MSRLRSDTCRDSSQRAAEGIRTLDLLHGKQNVRFPLGSDIACKCTRSRVWVVALRFPGFTGSPREFGHPMGTRRKPPRVGRKGAGAPRELPPDGEHLLRGLRACRSSARGCRYWAELGWAQ